MRFTVRRCTHYRDDNSNARGIEFNFELWRFCLNVLIAL